MPERDTQLRERERAEQLSRVLRASSAVARAEDEDITMDTGIRGEEIADAIDWLLARLEAVERELEEAKRDFDFAVEEGDKAERERDDALTAERSLRAMLESAGTARDTMREALERIADENDPLHGIGSESEFAHEALSAAAPPTKE